MKILEHKEYTFKCPYCFEYEFNISHLMNKNTIFGEWYCDNCGHAVKGEIKNKKLTIIKTASFQLKTLVLLRYENILLIVEGFILNNDKSYHKFYYEESTCPINFLRKIIKIIYLPDKDDDPHGLFEFLTEIPFIDIDTYSYEDLEKLFNYKLLV